MKTIYLDTETTGLDPWSDDVLEITLLADDGTIELDTLVKPPAARTDWKAAEKIHHITPEMVANAPALTDLVPTLVEIFSRYTDLVIYNRDYDLPFLQRAYIDAEMGGYAPIHLKSHCAMKDYAEEIGDWNDYRNDFKWHKLTAAAAHVGHVWEGQAHRALADCQATRSVWHWLQQQGANKNV